MPLIGTHGAASSSGFGRFGGGGDLYEFTSHTFSSTNKTGAYGPSYSSLVSAYSSATWASNTSFFDVFNGIQLWKVPVTANYSFVVSGAPGGDDTGLGGRGMAVTATIPLIMGNVLAIVVGQKGTLATSCNHDAGGGGGSFVLSNSTSMSWIASADADAARTRSLIIGGGGGGGCNGAYRDGIAATSSNNGTNNAKGDSGGGTNGLGGGVKNGNYGGGGGAGVAGNGSGNWQQDRYWTAGGFSSLYNDARVFRGGIQTDVPGGVTTAMNIADSVSLIEDSQYGIGGFGGGGAARGVCWAGGGGGGGYSGGRAGQDECGGGGGGSFVSASTYNVSYATHGSATGSVIVTKLG